MIAAIREEKIDYIFKSSGVARNTLRAGITPFDSSSDRRGLFVDVDLTQILGGPVPTIPATQYRDLHSTDPKFVAKYRSVLLVTSKSTELKKEQL
jgi:hypothetical protein